MKTKKINKKKRKQEEGKKELQKPCTNDECSYYVLYMQTCGCCMDFIVIKMCVTVCYSCVSFSLLLSCFRYCHRHRRRRRRWSSHQCLCKFYRIRHGLLHVNGG